jgi:hypothetical protein
MRPEWSGAMRRGHRAWIHPFARCGSATAITIARSNTGFGECRRRNTSDRQGGAYRADHRHPSRIETQLPTFPVPLSSCKRVRMTKAALHTAQHSSERRRTAVSAGAGQWFDRLGNRRARDPTGRGVFKFFLRNPQNFARQQTVALLPTAWPPDTLSIRRWPKSGMLSERMPFRLPPRSTTY